MIVFGPPMLSPDPVAPTVSSPPAPIPMSNEDPLSITRLPTESEAPKPIDTLAPARISAVSGFAPGTPPDQLDAVFQSPVDAMNWSIAPCACLGESGQMTRLAGAYPPVCCSRLSAIKQPGKPGAGVDTTDALLRESPRWPLMSHPPRFPTPRGLGGSQPSLMRRNSAFTAAAFFLAGRRRASLGRQ